MSVVGKNYRLQDIQLSKSLHLRPLDVSGQAAHRDYLATQRLPKSDLPAEASHAATPQGEAKSGGEYRSRTGDLLVANQALSQLS